MFNIKVASGIFGAAALAYAFTPSGNPNHGFKGMFRFTELQLQQAIPIARNAKKYTFKFDDPEVVSGIYPGSFVVARYKTPSGTVVRPYTPVSDVDTKGIVEFVIKTYPEGKMSSALAELQPGEKVSFMGPIKSYPYKANEFKHVSLIAGGSGITPMYQLIQAIAKDPSDKTKVDLFYGSKDENDILLKQELDKFSVESNGQINIHYFVSNPSSKWTGNKGRIDKEYLKSHLPNSSEETKVFVCGPDSFYTAICGTKPNPIRQGPFDGILKELGYKQNQVYKF